MFGIHLVHGIFADLFQAQEWEFLLGTSAVSLESRVTAPKWISPECTEAFSNFISAMPKIASSINFNDREWEQWS